MERETTTPVLEPVLKDGKLIYEFHGHAETPSPTFQAAAGAADFAGTFSDLGPIVGGGALAAGVGQVADRLLGPIVGQIGGGLGGGLGNLTPVATRVVAAWGVHAWGRRQWPTASKYAVAFLLYDAANRLINVNGIVRNLVAGLPIIGGGGTPVAGAPSSQAPTTSFTSGDPLLAGW